MKRAAVGCLLGMLTLTSLMQTQAQDITPTVLTDSPPLLVETATLVPLLPEITPSPELRVTPVPTLTPVSTEMPILLPPALNTAEPTPTPTSTAAVIVLPTQDVTASVSASQTPLPTAVPTMALRLIEGQALYPNRVLGQAFIRVQTFTAEGMLLATAYTNDRGLYAVTGLADQVTRMNIDAPLYLTETQYVAPGVTPYVVILRGGDLDGDACVSQADVKLLTEHYSTPFAGADLDGSGIVDVIDLTLLSANYDDTCLSANPPTATALPLTLDPTLAVTPADLAATATEPLLITAEATSDLPTLTPVPSATPVLVPTETPLIPEATAEATEAF